MRIAKCCSEMFSRFFSDLIYKDMAFIAHIAITLPYQAPQEVCHNNPYCSGIREKAAHNNFQKDLELQYAMECSRYSSVNFLKWASISESENLRT